MKHSTIPRVLIFFLSSVFFVLLALITLHIHIYTYDTHLWYFYVLYIDGKSFPSMYKFLEG